MKSATNNTSNQFKKTKLMTPSQSELIAHWPFTDSTDSTGSTLLPATNHNIQIAPSLFDAAKQVAYFNGLDSFLEVANNPALNLGTDDFSISVQIETEEKTDIVGDIISRFDSNERRGWSLNVVTNSGVTSTSQSNYRHLHFGIDSATPPGKMQDCGRPGNAAFIYSLATINGDLYAGTFEREAEQTGHLWRYKGDGQWHHCGATPDGSSAIPTMTVFDGELYCGTGRYNPVGSRLGPIQNNTPGGHVYRVDEEGNWHDCGVPGGEDATPESTPTEGYDTGKADEVLGLTVFQGKLYCTSFHRRGAFVYEGGKNWKYIGPDERLMSFTIHREHLYCLVNGGPVYRYEGGEEWTFCGRPGGSDQIYSGANYRGELLVGTWPTCDVMRYDGGQEWTSFGRVGYEMEVMGMLLYNAKIYFGTLPMANVWRLDDNDYQYIGNVDNSPEVYLRRAWSMAVHQGKLFVGTLPSGHVLSFEAGRMATHDHVLPAGRHHVAAVREKNVLKIYLDGKQVAQSSTFDAADFNLDSGENLKIGFGPHQFFKGTMSDLRLYRGALTAEEIQHL
jgi:hypothetical protein